MTVQGSSADPRDGCGPAFVPFHLFKDIFHILFFKVLEGRQHFIFPYQGGYQLLDGFQ